MHFSNGERFASIPKQARRDIVIARYQEVVRGFVQAGFGFSQIRLL